MIKTIVSGLMIGMVSMIAASSSWAQSQLGYYSAHLQADWYGNGTHQYYDGKYADAIRSFSTAISVNPNDPRPYFFRGLSKLNCDGPLAAAADFQQGAFREAYKSGRASSAVNRSLERIQGACRLEIEQHRREARLAYHMRSVMPSANSPPVMFGDMVDVDSIVPIIKHVIPPINADAPGPAMDPPAVRPREDVDVPLPGKQESNPEDVVPQPDEQNGLPDHGVEYPPPPPDNQMNDPFGG